MSHKVELGDLIRDRLSGFIGIVTEYTERMFGSDKALVTPCELLENGSLKSSFWFDVAQLQVLEKKKLERPILISGMSELEKTIK